MYLRQTYGHVNGFLQFVQENVTSLQLAQSQQLERIGEGAVPVVPKVPNGFRFSVRPRLDVKP